MRFLTRRRGRMLVAFCMAGCFAINNCADTASLSLVRIGFSSFTLPINQALLGGSALLNSVIGNAILGLLGFNTVAAGS